MYSEPAILVGRAVSKYLRVYRTSCWEKSIPVNCERDPGYLYPCGTCLYRRLELDASVGWELRELNL